MNGVNWFFDLRAFTMIAVGPVKSGISIIDLNTFKSTWETKWQGLNQIYKTCLCSCMLRHLSMWSMTGDDGGCVLQSPWMSLNLRKSWIGEGTASCSTMSVLISWSGPSTSRTLRRQRWKRQGTKSKMWKEKIHQPSVNVMSMK